MSDYRVIDCDLHDLYEIAVLRRRRLLLNWRDAAGLDHLELLAVTDIQTRADGEVLVAIHPDGRPVEIRLDTILHARDPATGEEFPVRPHQSDT
jgi:transcriptional antiterminator Rof (Rho-off)